MIAISGFQCFHHPEGKWTAVDQNSNYTLEAETLSELIVKIDQSRGGRR